MRIVLLTTSLAVILSGVALMIVELNRYRHSWAEDLSTEASILSVSIAPALAFNDHETATRDLAALRARSRVMAAALYLDNGSLYASFARSETESLPVHPPPPGIYTSGQRVELTRVILRNGEYLGTLYLRAEFDSIGRIMEYTGIFALVTLLALAAAFLLSRRLQRGIAEPLDEMASLAQAIALRQDYSLRVKNTSDDEVGVVVDAFNNMLKEVEIRSRALFEANQALTQEVEVRKFTQAELSLAKARLDSTMAAAEIGTWSWNIADDTFSADRNLTRLYGLQDGALDGAPDLQHDHVHPEDQERLKQGDHSALVTGVFAPSEFRILHVDGSERWVARRGKVQLDGHGKATSISGLLIDITAQKEAENALRVADRRKDEFLATLAHELRNPLAPVRHAVKILEAKSLTRDQDEWARNVIARQVQRMALLLDDLLDVSRITRGRLELNIEEVTMASIVDAAVETVSPLISARRHRLTIKVPSDPVMLRVDALRISQSLSNLLTNSAKYTNEEGEITLQIRLTAGEVLLSVADSGIGIDPKAHSGLFEMFSQVGSSLSRSEGGLGIGLALVKGLVELHGGTIEAQSAGLGKGSEFTIHLPSSLVVSKTASTAGPAPKPSAQAADHSVVLVDDNRDAADTLAMVLSMKGYHTQVAYNGAHALQRARDLKPDAMVIDLGMPDISGFEVARTIREEPWGQDVFLVALTGWGQKDDIARAMSSGFDHHFTKPADPEEVLRILRCHLDRPTTERSCSN